MMHRAGSSGKNRPGGANWTTANHTQLCALISVQRSPSTNRDCTLLLLVGQTRVFLGAAFERFSYGRNRGVLGGHNRPLQRNLQHFIHGLD